MNLIEIYKPMIYSIIKKYDIPGYTSEDLFQEGVIALLKAQESFDENKNMKMETWIYNSIKWHLGRLVEKNKKYNNEVSYNKRVDTSIELLDTFLDPKDSYQEVESAIMLDTYKHEIERIIPEDKLDICILKWFQNFSNSDIEASLNVHNVSSKIVNCRMELIRKSTLFRNEYYKIHGIRENIPEQAII